MRAIYRDAPALAPQGGWPLARTEGWESRLAALVEERRRVPFQWGANDCTLFAADAVLAITGFDTATNHRGWYSDRASALRHLARGWRSLEALATYNLGPPIEPLRAMRGDVALGLWATDTFGRQALGVVLGRHVVTPGPAGLVFNSLRTAIRAWPVGR